MSSDKEVAGQGARRELAGQNEREAKGDMGTNERRSGYLFACRHIHTASAAKKRHTAPKDATLVDEKVSDGNGGDVTGVAIAMIILPPSEPAELPVTLPEYQSCCATANRTRQAATAQLVASGSCTPRHLPRPITHADIADDADLQSQARNQHYRVEYTKCIITSTLALRLSSQQRRAVSERVHALRPPTPFGFRALRAVLSCLLLVAAEPRRSWRGRVRVRADAEHTAGKKHEKGGMESDDATMQRRRTGADMPVLGWRCHLF
ncbi:hypothetical protein V495_05052 [Pseudogymnoascus sp. VKM F-4514 (FW-929)]|nr:hypothetical protein V495_05052 [Pseudogymnoascus sp. VKM F-4514 (FW-929)]KFY54429.1 hypothetical protein V497_07720 [Pseudogymnoascus sp. VKM F-4516 (FW-969)]